MKKGNPCSDVSDIMYFSKNNCKNVSELGSIHDVGLAKNTTFHAFSANLFTTGISNLPLHYRN